MTIQLGDAITIGVVLITAIFNYIRSKTKIEIQLKYLTEQVKKQNGNIAKAQEWQQHHVESCHSK